MRVPIITDEAAQQGGWHGIALSQAFAHRGYEAVFVELQDCLIDLSSDLPSISIPQFESLPPFAFIRGIAAGTLQQVITRLNILHMLKMQGTYIYNDAKAIERTVDKGMTSFLLKQHGIPTPATWVCESRQQAHAIIQTQLQQHAALVIKPLFGSQGQGVRLIQPQDSYPLPRDLFVDGVYYLQQKIETGAHNFDYRVFVVNNQAVATMQRSGEGWLHNVARGAQCTWVQDVSIATLAESAAKALNIDYCGVDIIRDAESELWVLEVNSIPAWRGLQSVCTVNIAQLVVDDLIQKAQKVHN
ncbi:MAG: alpha-L-glutamate ligase [Methylophilales bacterium 28-44-11]|nr:MAG: alpha-L-glutamate ligase [Methylophilales bacterium 28-44-11]